MKIVILIQCANLGGMEQASVRLCLALRELGHSVEFLSLNPVGGLRPILESHNIKYVALTYEGVWGWRSALKARKTLSRLRPDALLMTGHHLLTMLVLGTLCRNRRVLAVHYHHGGVRPNWQWKLIYRAACRTFNRITFPSDFIRKEAELIEPMVARLGVTLRNPMQLPTAIPMKEKQRAREFFGIPEEVPVIGNAGWLVRRKRFDVFLRTAEHVLRFAPEAQFLVAGDGEEKTNLLRLANELGIAGKVRWVGWQVDMRRFYGALDVLLFNSDWDALPTTPQEAMSYGVPVVASVVRGGLSEVITSEDLGYNFATHDVGLLAETVIALVRSREKRERIALSSQLRIETACNPGAIAKAMESYLIQGK